MAEANCSPSQREVRGSLEGGVFEFVADSSLSVRKSSFSRETAFPAIVQTLENSLPGAIVSSSMRVIPVQLFAQIRGFAAPVALTGISYGEALAALKKSFRHAARFCRFDAGKGLGQRRIAARRSIANPTRASYTCKRFFTKEFQPSECKRCA